MARSSDNWTDASVQTYMLEKKSDVILKVPVEKQRFWPVQLVALGRHHTAKECCEKMMKTVIEFKTMIITAD